MRTQHLWTWIARRVDHACGGGRLSPHVLDRQWNNDRTRSGGRGSTGGLDKPTLLWVQALLSHNQGVGRRPATEVTFALASLVRCAACGRHAHGTTDSHGNQALACPLCA